jgi:hypothetical protein
VLTLIVLVVHAYKEREFHLQKLWLQKRAANDMFVVMVVLFMRTFDPWQVVILSIGVHTKMGCNNSVCIPWLDASYAIEL